MRQGAAQAVLESRRRTLPWTLITTSLTLLCGPVPFVIAEDAPLPLTRKRVELGRQLYTKQCAVCHGASGRGDGAAAYLLYPKPRDFTRGEYRLISTQEMVATDADLFQTITRGMPGSSMPSWEALSDEERWALVYYVRYLAGVGKLLDEGELTEAEVEEGLPWERVRQLISAHADAQSMEVPPKPVGTPETLAQGRAIYAQACAACHGPEGRGDAQVSMEDSLGVPVKPRDLTAGLFKGSSESRDLYYRIMAGLPGSPMPSYAGAYSGEEVWALVQYVQSLVPSGVDERVQMHPRTIRARHVEGPVPLDPFADVWESVDGVYLAVTPLWWRDERIPGVDIQALHDGQRMAIRVSWDDATVDESAVRTEDFPDGIAVQLSAADDPPFFGMGDAHDAVNIWHWKASWQRDVAKHADVEDVYPGMVVEYYPNQENWEPGTHQENVERATIHHDPELLTGWGADNPFADPRKQTPAEELRARGQGTLTASPGAFQRVAANGARREGRWSVVLARALEMEEPGAVVLTPGASVSLAVAVWDGAAEDRDGQKSFSIWHTLTLE